MQPTRHDKITAPSSPASSVGDNLSTGTVNSKKRLSSPTFSHASSLFPESYKLMAPDPILLNHQILGYSSNHQSNLHWLNDNKCVVYTSYKLLLILNTATKEQKMLSGHTENICCLACDPSGIIFASAQDGIPLIRIWDLSSGKCNAILRHHESNVCALAISDSRCTLAAVGRDKYAKQIIVLWDISQIRITGKANIIAKQTSDFHISAIKFAPFEDSKLITCGRENVRFWRIKNGILRGCSLASEHNLRKENFTSISFERTFPGVSESDDYRVFASTHNGTLFQIDYGKRIIEGIFRLHEGSITCMHMIEGICATSSDDRFVRVWPLDFSDYFVEAEHESPVQSVAISIDGQKLAVGTQNGSIGILELSTQQYKTLVRTHTSETVDISMSMTDNQFATVSSDGSIRVWDLDTFQQIYQFDTVGESPCSVVYHPTQNLIACGFNSGIIRLFVTKEIKMHKGAIIQLYFTPDAARLISASHDSLCIIDCGHHYQPIKLFHYMKRAQRVAISVSNDGKQMASIGPSGNMIEIYDTTTYEEKCSFETSYSDVFTSLSFSLDGKALFASTTDGRILKIDINRGLLVTEEIISEEEINCISLSPNGKYFLTGCSDKILRVHPSNMEEPFQSFIGHCGEISKCIFTPDSSHVISCGKDSLIIWKFVGNTFKDLSFEVNHYLERKEKGKELGIDAII